MIMTVEACSALGAADGSDYASRQIQATNDAFFAAASGDREAVVREIGRVWAAAQIEDRSKRRLELAFRGANAACLIAYETAREMAFGMVMSQAAAAIDAALAPPPPNRNARRRAAKTGEALQ